MNPYPAMIFFFGIMIYDLIHRYMFGEEDKGAAEIAVWGVIFLLIFAS